MKLTKEQQKLVEENHNLIYSFCYKYNLDIEEWYDIFAIALCEAIKKWDNTRSNLSTFVYVKFKTTMLMEYRNSKALKRGREFTNISIDNETFTLEIEDTKNIENNVVDKIVSQEKIKTLKHSDQKLLLMRLKGYNQKEIAEKMGVSQPSISRRFKHIEKRLTDD